MNLGPFTTMSFVATMVTGIPTMDRAWSVQGQLSPAPVMQHTMKVGSKVENKSLPVKDNRYTARWVRNALLWKVSAYS